MNLVHCFVKKSSVFVGSTTILNIFSKMYIFYTQLLFLLQILFISNTIQMDCIVAI